MSHREQMFGTAISTMMSGVQMYVTAYKRAYNSNLGDDYVLGDNMKDILTGMLGLLNGECGTKDPGTLDHDIREIARRAGIDLDK